MYTTLELIAAFGERELLSPAEVQRLIRLYQNSPSDFGPRVLLKWMVSQQRLKVEPAERIQKLESTHSVDQALEETLGPVGGSAKSAPAAKGPAPAAPKPKAGDDLDLAPLESDEEPMPQAAPKSAPASTPAAAAAKKPTPTTKSSTSDLFDDLVAAHDPLSMKTTRPRAGRWDSPLMLAGGAGLLLLLIGGVFLWWRIARDQADETFQSAEEAYHQAAYPLAVERFNAFLESYPDHLSAGTAVVHRGMSQIRLESEAGGDWTSVLDTAERVLAQIAPREEFAAVRPDLGVLLPEIAQQLAKQALEKNDPKLLGTARRARGLVDKYAGGSEQAAVRLADVDALMTTAERRLAREQRIAETVDAMRKALAAGKPTEALAARSALLREFLDAATAPALVEATAAISVAAAKAVRWVDEVIAPATDERPTAVTARTTLIQYSVEDNATAGNVCLASAGGVLFALDTADGRLRWRRNVGLDARFAPTKVDVDGKTLVVLDEVAHDELTAVDLDTGKLRFRVAVPRDERLWVSAAADRLLVTLGSGRLMSFDLKTGAGTGYVQFPEEVVGQAVADPRERVRYQLARSGRVYILDAATLACLESGVIGHESGYVSLSPLAVGTYLVVVETPPAGGSVVRLFTVNAEGRGLTPAGTLPLADAVRTPPRASQRIVMLADDRGGLTALDLSRPAGAESITPAASHAPEGPTRRMHYLTFRGGELWSAGHDLRRFELQPAVSRISPLKSTPLDGAPQGEPQLMGDRIIDVRTTTAGQLVASAVNVADGSILWQTRLATPWLAGPIFDPGLKQVGIVTPTALHTIAAADDAAPPATSEPAYKLESALAAVVAGSKSSLWLPSAGEIGVAAATEPAGASEWLLVRLKEQDPRTRRLSLVDVSSRPMVVDGSMLSAGIDGQISWIDPATGGRKGTPIQPPLVAGRAVEWSDFARHEGIAVIADRSGRLCAIEIDPKSTSLKQQAMVDLPRRIAASPAVVGRTVYCIDDANLVLSYSLPQLTPGADWQLSSAPLWDPVQAGNAVYVAAVTDGGTELSAFSGDGKQLWRRIVAGDAPDGCHPPTADGDRLYVATTAGEIVVIDPSSGEISKRISCESPITGSPIIIGRRLAVPSLAGELLWLDIP